MLFLKTFAGPGRSRAPDSARFFLPGAIFLSIFLTLFPFPATAQNGAHLADDELLDLISRKAFDYFVMEADPGTGLVYDRAHNLRRGSVKAPASIAATGFGLSALAAGVERGWIDRGTARERARRILMVFEREAAGHEGFFYHFLNARTGERSGKSELSPIDTALFLAGAMTAAEYFEDPALRASVQRIYERVNWPWMLHGGETFALAWSPEQGFNRRRWDHYDESMILYLLAIGSPTHPIPADSWEHIARPLGSYGGYRLIQMPPLFTHQYSHIWIDFRSRNDGTFDYFQNSVNASRANRAFCMDQASRYRTYGPNAWGLTASDGPFGYRAYGAPPGWADHDGTLAPTGCGSSIVFTPEESIACLRHYYENYGDRLWGMYGFSDAFNLDRDWFSDQVIGIDQGALLLMIENYRSGLIWNLMRKNPYLSAAMEAVGFREGSLDIPWPEPPVYEARQVPGGIRIDSYLKDWPQMPAIHLGPDDREVGNIGDSKDLSADVRFIWSREALYFMATVRDDSLLLRRRGKHIWQDDLIEIYIDPQGDGLQWEDSSDYQIGFRPNEKEEAVEVWSWFQPGGKSLPHAVAARGYVHEEGYVIEGGIRWSLLERVPEEGMKLKLSVAVHDTDSDRTEGKLQWFFRNEGGLKRFNLGNIVLGPASGRKPDAGEAGKDALETQKVALQNAG